MGRRIDAALEYLGLRYPPYSFEERSTINLSQYAQAWNQSYGVGYSPMPVGTARALTHAASAACVDLQVRSVSTLPVDVVREQGNRRVRVASEPPLIAQPSVLVERDVWVAQVVESVLTDGNAFGFVGSYDVAGRPTSINLVDAAHVGDRRVGPDGVPAAAVLGERHKLYPWGDLWHLPGKHVKAGSPFAESPVQRAAATIGTALAAREFGGRFFSDGGHPGGILKSTSDREITAEQAAEAKRAFMNAVKGTREPAALGGWDYQPIITGDGDAGQFIELQRFVNEEVARFWGVPARMLDIAVSGEALTYANVAQSDLHYLKHSLEWLLIRLETALTKLLPRPQFVRFNRNAFLRTDPEARWKIHDLRLRNGSTWVNEVRALEDEEPIPGDEFDRPGVPIHPPHLPEE